MRNYYLKTFLMLLFFNSICYAQTFDWAIQFKGVENLETRDIVVDNLGNVYTTGWFYGSVDFDPSSNVFDLSNFTASRSLFITKVNANGTLIWAKKIGETGYNEGYALFLDSNSNIFITGYFTETQDFDPGSGVANLSSKAFHDAFALKLDTNGNFIWAKSMGGTSVDMGYSIVADASGVYLTGRFQETMDLDPGSNTYNVTSNGSLDVFVVKLDAIGNFLWGFSIGSTWIDNGETVALDSSGNLVLLTRFSLNADFDPSPATKILTSSGDTDIGIAKYDSSGKLLWAKSMGGFATEEPSELIIDSMDNIYTTGYFTGTADFDPNAAVYSLSSTGSLSTFISKLNSNGDFIWAKAFKGNGGTDTKDIAIDSANNVYVVGLFTNTTDFNPDPSVTYDLTSNGNNDVYVAKLKGSGDFEWAIKVGGVGNDFGRAIAVDKNSNSVYSTGVFEQTVDFDTSNSVFNLTSGGLKDVFILKLKQSNLNTKQFDANSVSIYPNPVKDFFKVQSDQSIKSIQIIDSQGKIVFEENDFTLDHNVNVKDFSKGIYFVKLNVADISIVKKIIKN